jgi:hypothetical protein
VKKFFLFPLFLFAATLLNVSARDSITINLKIDGVERQALVFPAPDANKKTNEKSPLEVIHRRDVLR